MASKAEHKLSPEETLAYKEAFAYFDQDGNGSITVSELGEVLNQLGQTPTVQELKDMISEVDADRNGTIEFSEFIDMMSRQQREKDEIEELKNVFKVFDQDGNGYITTEELAIAMKRLGNELSDKEVEFMIREADQDGDNQVDFEEFKAIMKSK